MEWNTCNGNYAFLFMVLTWQFIDQSLPLALHLMAEQQEVRDVMSYEKKNGRKHGRQRLELIETPELESSDLCLTEHQRNSLAETGELTVIGTRSRFGMVLEDVKVLPAC